MKRYGLALPRKATTFVLWLAVLIFLAVKSEGAYYQAGQIVTNFVVYARPAWTNSGGFTENQPMRLQDFSGKILFVEFFDPT